MQRYCQTCDRPKELEEFNWKIRINQRKYICLICNPNDFPNSFRPNQSLEKKRKRRLKTKKKKINSEIFGISDKTKNSKKDLKLKCTFKKAKNQNIKNSNEREKVKEKLKTYYTNLFFYLKKHPCIDCGESNPLVLTFDHIRDKTCNISSIRHKPWEEVMEEIQKCEVRCANCHMIKTAHQFDFTKISIFKLLQKVF